MKTVKKDNEVNVKVFIRDHLDRVYSEKEELTRVFQLMGSTNPFTTSAISSAPMRARPILVGSRFMHSSHSPH